MSDAKPVFIASDAHLGAAPPEQERAFLRWLEHAGRTAGEVILNGDVFDFWFEYRWGTTRGYDAVLGLLRRLVDGGVPVTLVGGNHDWWGGAHLREEIGITVQQEPRVRDLAGRRSFLAHGDGLGRGDLGYRLLKGVLRGRATRWAYGLLPPSVGDAVAHAVSRTGRKWDDWGPHQEARSRALAEWAQARLLAEPELELVVLGHTHRPLLREVRRGKWYVNTGDWVVHRSYVVLERGRAPRLVEWNGGAP
ncbi:MAG TPA: UDP-2,3-diacylglucosamine diphosphatase [Longimicrobiales bacterium]|nr:UDP-2,3-diacylglucosamine diphosphatase [Longimicrobiales bacterium]